MEKRQHRRNEQITGASVLLIKDGGKPEPTALREALAWAWDRELDLVEIAVNNGMSVCKAMDYGAFKYHESKRQQENSKKNRDCEIKEMRFRPVTDEGDFQTKLRQMSGFLEKGHKVKVAIRFKGREVTHANIGFEMMGKIAASLSEIAKAEYREKLEGRQLVGMFSPLAKTKAKG